MHLFSAMFTFCNNKTGRKEHLLFLQPVSLSWLFFCGKSFVTCVCVNSLEEKCFSFTLLWTWLDLCVCKKKFNVTAHRATSHHRHKAFRLGQGSHTVTLFGSPPRLLTLTHHYTISSHLLKKYIIQDENVEIILFHNRNGSSSLKVQAASLDLTLAASSSSSSNHLREFYLFALLPLIFLHHPENNNTLGYIPKKFNLKGEKG